MTRVRYGDREVCATCGLDVEWQGKRQRRNDGSILADVMVGGWTDRGGNHYCDMGGGARWDRDGVPIPMRHVLHRPTKESERP